MIPRSTASAGFRRTPELWPIRLRAAAESQEERRLAFSYLLAGLGL